MNKEHEPTQEEVREYLTNLMNNPIGRKVVECAYYYLGESWDRCGRHDQLEGNIEDAASDLIFPENRELI